MEWSKVPGLNLDFMSEVGLNLRMPTINQVPYDTFCGALQMSAHETLAFRI